MTKVTDCTCKHAFQDKTYGKGKRVHNSTSTENHWRCTVCGKINISK